MKILIASLLAFALPIAAQADSRCSIRQKNAASVKLAETLNMLVQDVSVTNYTAGAWTQGMAYNNGYDFVEVMAGETTTRYIVFAEQQGTSDDCQIVLVAKDESPAGN